MISLRLDNGPTPVLRGGGQQLREGTEQSLENADSRLNG